MSTALASNLFCGGSGHQRDRQSKRRSPRTINGRMCMPLSIRKADAPVGCSCQQSMGRCSPRPWRCLPAKWEREPTNRWCCCWMARGGTRVPRSRFPEASSYCSSRRIRPRSSRLRGFGRSAMSHWPIECSPLWMSWNRCKPSAAAGSRITRRSCVLTPASIGGRL